MKPSVRLASLTVLLSALCGLNQSCDGSTNSDDSVFMAKAQELTRDKTSRIDKLQAIHAFVRDDIALAKTQYG